MLRRATKAGRMSCNMVNRLNCKTIHDNTFYGELGKNKSIWEDLREATVCLIPGGYTIC